MTHFDTETQGKYKSTTRLCGYVYIYSSLWMDEKKTQEHLESGRTEGQEHMTEVLGLAVHAVDEREAQLGVEELLGGLAADLVVLELLHVDDVDARGTGTVVRRHVVVHLLHSTAARDVTVLLVDVVGGVRAVVAQEDAEGLRGVRAALVELLARKNLAGRRLHLAHLREEVPEARLGNDLVRRKDAHAVDLLLRLVLRVALTANDLVFLHLKVTTKTKKHTKKRDKEKKKNKTKDKKKKTQNESVLW